MTPNLANQRSTIEGEREMITSKLHADGEFAMGEERPFVVKYHVAAKPHFDFRLGFNGLLVSWAVPKGPSVDPAVKRLAVRVADHSMSGFNSERVIPEGEYGAGPVLVWDRGTYRNITKVAGRAIPMGRALKMGTITIEIHGTKLRGVFTLKHVGGTQGEYWLLVKQRDRWAVPGSDITAQPRSVLSGRSIEEVAADWTTKPRSNRQYFSGDLFTLP
jgi:bifunctional non-homologous end joining protein LigD